MLAIARRAHGYLVTQIAKATCCFCPVPHRRCLHPAILQGNTHSALCPSALPWVAEQFAVRHSALFPFFAATAAFLNLPQTQRWRACCLTSQSTGRAKAVQRWATFHSRPAPASRVAPVIGDVRPHTRRLSAHMQRTAECASRYISYPLGNELVVVQAFAKPLSLSSPVGRQCTLNF